MTENMFSLCYGFPEGGSMLLGESGGVVLSCKGKTMSVLHA